MKKYDVNYFIKKFSKIPESKWCVRERVNRNGQRCAHGLCYDDNDYYMYPSNSVEESLQKLASKFGYTGIGPINNGTDKRYKQKTPKKRVIAALMDLKNNTIIPLKN